MRVGTTCVARTGGRYRWKEGPFTVVQSGKCWRNYRWVAAQITAVGRGGNYRRLGILRPGVGDADFISRVAAAIGVIGKPGLRVRATRVARAGGRYRWEEGAFAIIQSGKCWRNYCWVAAQITAVGRGG
ncbi:MAG: hypothetical protein H6574_17150 [Lewinellaceae bacterium]|nr:hypothetical protein [Lewinellaceae bacterium]